MMYERELKLISEQSKRELDQLTKENDQLKRQAEDANLNQHIAGQIEQTHASQTKVLLTTTKSELEKAAATIQDLNNEIKIQ